jgi:hypothetical protein
MGATFGTGERRRGAPRVPIDAVIQARVPATPIDARLLDVSTTGCLIQTPHIDRVARGATILLSLSHSEHVSGQVVRISGSRFGVRFHHQLASQSIALLKQHWLRTS